MKLFLTREWVAAISMFVAGAAICEAVETRTWEQTDQSEFDRGTRKGLSIRSDGRVTLAPQFKELVSTNVPYLWAVGQDSKGTIFYGGGAPTGATAKIYALHPGGKPTVLAEIPGLEVHALAVDREDRVYAAMLPDAKIFRISPAGKPELFFDPKCKYIWSMAFDHSGNLFVATGDGGLIYKVTPVGNGSKFFDTQETHARSMIIDDAGNLIVGTEPSGLVLRITPQGQSFVVYQAAKREVTAVAERDGLIYAAAVGSKSSNVSVSGSSPVLPAAPSPISGTGAPRTGTTPPSLPPAVGSFGASVPGGSDLYRIDKEGFAERIWASPTDLVYAVTFDPNGKPLLGTGNKGVIYRVDSDQLSTELLTAPPTQVTAFLQGRDGVVYAATGNVGNLYSIGPSLEKDGTLESEVLDATAFAYWGKAHLTAERQGGSIELEVRSGNVNNPRNSWSPWVNVTIAEQGGSIASPPSRFLQYRLTLRRPDSAQSSPVVSSVDIPFLLKNIAPRVQQIEIAPFNYRQPASSSLLERSVTASGSPLTLTLPAVGQKKSSTPSVLLESAGGATLQYSKGYVTARWNASDANSDPLLYRVEIRERNGTQWQLLKDKLSDRFFSFDSTTFPDGQYLIRVTASDSPGNIPAKALSSSLESDRFTIDNTPPEIEDLKPSQEGTLRHIAFTAKDALSWIDKAEYSTNGVDWVTLEPLGRVTDSQTLQYRFDAPGDGPIALRVFDEDDNVTVKQVGK